MIDTLEGGCACGAIRYRLNDKPMFVHCCHCRDCQRLTGSAFVVNAIIENDNITLLTGAPRPTSVPTASGRPHDIYRCETCQTALWSDYGHRPNYRFVRGGTFDDPTAIALMSTSSPARSFPGCACRTAPAPSISSTISTRNGRLRASHGERRRSVVRPMRKIAAADR